MTQSAVSNLKAIYSHLTNPPIPTDNLATVLRMRLISSLFLCQTVLAFAIAFIYTPIQSDNFSVGASVGFGLMSLVCYVLSRTEHYKKSIYLYVALMTVSLFSLYVATSNIPDTLPEYILSYLIAVIIFTSLLLSIRTTLILSTICLIGIAALPLINPNLQHPIHHLWLFTVTTSILIIVAAMIRDNVFQRLQTSENQARNLMAAYLDAVVIWSPQAGIVAINPAFTELLGYTSDEVLHQSIDTLGKTQQSQTLIVANSQLDYKSQPYEVELAHKQGESIVVEIINQPYEYENQPTYVFVMRDMRQYKEAVRQQHEQEIRYQSLLELTDDAVFIADFEGAYIAVNQQAADMLKMSVEELIGKSFRDIVPQPYHTASERVIERLLAGEPIPMYERTFIQSNGHRFPVEVMERLLRDVNGDPEYIHSVVRDISNRKQAEDQRLELIVERERMTTLQNFLGDASHYFRTPLTSLKTSQYLLTQIHDNPVKEAHFLNVMKLEIARLERLLSDMMLSTQLDQDTGNGLTFGRLDLGTILPEIVKTFSPSEKRETYADIIIEPAITRNQLYIMASRSKLSTALHRIIDNAITYSPADSTVTIYAYREQHNICIAIKDEGIGITEDEMSSLFERFRRADRAVEMAHVGNGLGLFIAKKIIEMHYGEIHVESVPDEGSTFTVYLPNMLSPKT